MTQNALKNYISACLRFGGEEALQLAREGLRRYRRRASA